MNTKDEQTFSSVISINPYAGEYYIGSANFISKTDNPRYAKEQYAISFINTKDFLHAQLGISKNIPEEDIKDALIHKAYDELALDQAVEYRIEAIESFANLDDENKYFHVFISDPLELDSIFESTLEKIKYIDTIIPTPLLIKSLYTKEIVDSNGVDCYVYIQENDAFLTIYNEQNFLDVKSLKFSLLEMHEKFCELYGEQIEYEKFCQFLSNENLRTSDSPYIDSILKLYKELFTNINEVLTYTKRRFELDKIDRIYIGSSLYFESKLYEILETEISVKSYLFEFDYGFENSGAYIDQMHQLMYLNTMLSEEKKYLINFSSYHRPPKFLKRESGKIIALTLISFIIAFAYPVTYWSLGYAQNMQLVLLRNNYNEIHSKKIIREATLQKKRADLKKVTELLNNEKKDFQEKKTTLIKIKKIKSGYIMKAKILTTFTKQFNTYDVKVRSLGYHETDASKKFFFDLVATNSSKITKLLKHLTNVYQNEFKFDLKTIMFDPKTKLYFSRLEASKL